MNYKIIFIYILSFLCVTSCNNKKDVDITPYITEPKADSIYQLAIALVNSSFDVDSTSKAMVLLDQALSIDSMNPDYYGVKAKLLAEMGYLDSALNIQTLADQKGAITGEYLFQLGLFQAAKDKDGEAHKSFERSNNYLKAVLEKYPDSLGAFMIQQAAYALYKGEDSLFMNDICTIRKRYPDRLMEIEMTRRLDPSSLIKQLKNIEKNAIIEDMTIDLDSLEKNN